MILLAAALMPAHQQQRTCMYGSAAQQREVSGGETHRRHPPAKLSLSCTSSGDSWPHSSLRCVKEGVLTICLDPMPAPPGVTAPTPPAAAAAAFAADRAKLVCGVLNAPVGRGGASSTAAAVAPAAEGVSAAALVLLAWLRGAPLGVRGVVMVDSAAGGSRSSLSSSAGQHKTAETQCTACHLLTTNSMSAVECSG